MKIKKGDQVKIISGSSKGTIAKVRKVMPREDKLIVEGVNLVKKHMKPTQGNPEGGIFEKEMPIHISNVMAYDAKAKKASKLGIKTEKGKKVRYYKSSGNVLKDGN